MEVVGDHLAWRDENPGSMLSRVWDTITGETARRQQALERSVEGVLNGVKERLIALQNAQASSDIAITRVAKHLLETRRFVMALEAKHQHLLEDAAAINQRLDEHIERTESGSRNCVRRCVSKARSAGLGTPSSGSSRGGRAVGSTPFRCYCGRCWRK